MKKLFLSKFGNFGCNYDSISLLTESNKFHFVIIVFSLLLLSFNNVSAKDLGAPNIDFSNGDITGWTLETGDFYRLPDNTCTYEWTGTDSETKNRFSIINSTISDDDPIVKCDDFKENPFSDGALTMRIGTPEYRIGAEGNGTYKAAAERATYKFTVTEESKALILNFACVIHDPTEKEISSSVEHIGDQIPYFGMNVEFRSQDGTVINDPCTLFESNKLKEYLKQPSTPCAYSLSRSLDEYSYLPWTTTVYDLTDKVGYEVTITFQTHDCLRIDKIKEDGEKAGGHEAYGYFYVETDDLELDVKYESDGTHAIIKAPKSFAHYKWSVDGKENSDLLIAGENDNEVKIDCSLLTSDIKLSCTMQGSLENCDEITFETEMSPILIAPRPNVSDIDICKDGVYDVMDAVNANEGYELIWFTNPEDTVGKALLSAPTDMVDSSKPGKYALYVAERAITDPYTQSSVTTLYVNVYDVKAPIDASKHEYCAGDDSEALKAEIVTDEKKYCFADEIVFVYGEDEQTTFTPNTKTTVSQTYKYKAYQKYTIPGSKNVCVGPSIDIEVSVVAVEKPVVNNSVVYSKSEAMSTNEFVDILVKDLNAIDDVPGQTLLWSLEENGEYIKGSSSNSRPYYDASITDGLAEHQERWVKWETITENGLTCKSDPEKIDIIISPITSIENIDAGNTDEVVNVYTVSGSLIRANVKKSEALKGLSNGTYVVGNQKVVFEIK